jgi:hypothetical protein
VAEDGFGGGDLGEGGGGEEKAKRRKAKRHFSRW